MLGILAGEGVKAGIEAVKVPEIAADIGKLKTATCWEPWIELKETLRDCLESWRGKV